MHVSITHFRSFIPTHSSKCSAMYFFFKFLILMHMLRKQLRKNTLYMELTKQFGST